MDKDNRAPDSFAGFLGEAADLGRSIGLDMPLLSNTPTGMSVPPGTEHTGQPKPVQFKQTLRVARFGIKANEKENEDLHVLLDEIANSDTHLIRQQKEQILNDGSIVVLLSYMILDKVVPKKSKDIADNEEDAKEPNAEAGASEEKEEPPATKPKAPARAGRKKVPKKPAPN